MSWTRIVATRFLVLLAVVAGAMLATTLPEAPSVGVALLTAALAALLVVAMRQVLLAGRVRPVAVLAADRPVPLLPGRVTDPTHHPLRPRAPGLA